MSSLIFRPSGLARIPLITHGLRRGLHSFAASRLGVRRLRIAARVVVHIQLLHPALYLFGIFRTPFHPQEALLYEQTISPTAAVFICVDPGRLEDRYAQSRHRRPPRIRNHELPNRRRRSSPDGPHQLRNLRPPQRRQRQCDSSPFALHGRLSRIRMAERDRACARHHAAISDHQRDVRQRTLFVSKQYTRALSWSALSADDHPR